MQTPGPTAPVLTDAERTVLGAATVYARRHDLAKPPEDAYRAEIPGARRSILHRFVGGLLRDVPAGLPESITISTRDPTVLTDGPAPLSGESGAGLLDAIEPLHEGCRAVSGIAFPESDVALLAPVATEHGFGRLALTGPVSRWSSEGAEHIDHPTEIVPLVEREGAFRDAEQARLIECELEESVANLAFARLGGRVQEKRCRDAGGSVSALARTIPGADRAASLERIVIEGHPFHFGAKIRRGMDAGAALAYAPEFDSQVHVRFVAVRTTHAKRESNGRRTLSDRLFALFAGLETALENALPPGCSPDEYAVIPVHPWQFLHVIPDRFRDRIADGRVVPLPYSHPATPLSNLRTVVPHATERTGEGPHPHLKLAIEVRTTNATRTLSPQAVHNGPRVTATLRTVAHELDGSLGFLSEPVATCYHEPGGPHPEGEAFDDARSLSGLLRQNPQDHPLVGEAVPIAVSSLIARSPATGRPLIADLAAQYRDSTDRGVEKFFRAYTECVIPDQLRLLSAYGIALESHAQNSLVAFDAGKPVATLVRDFGGVRVHEERLAAHDLAVESYPDSDVRADDERDLHRKLYYALFQNHLSELIVALVSSSGITEERCWDLVRAECERTFDELRDDPSIPHRRIDRDERALFSDAAEHKALTAMRLQGKRHEYTIARVPNPLAR
ncbi:MAG: IucA/IucC family siderophore biosynthesis protein [Euryarchaeota archaeon]|jgi:siderophore synthetase component|nr:IucA/IucC family siderophore biosynthesis protein [Euryarchaeota archaeon]